MVLPRTALPFLMVLLLAMIVAACGGNDDEATSSTASKEDSGTSAATDGQDAETDEQAEPSAAEAAEQRLSGGAASFSVTPALTACMTKAGFTSDAPPNGAIVAWTHSDGARVVVAIDSGQALQVASEIGSEQAPADVNDTTVTAGSAESTAAAIACIDAA